VQLAFDPSEGVFDITFSLLDPNREGDRPGFGVYTDVFDLVWY